MGAVPEADCTAQRPRHGQGKFTSVQTGLIRDLNLDLSMFAPCNQEKAKFQGFWGKNICEVASYLQPRLEELPSDFRRGSDISHGTAVAGTDQPASRRSVLFPKQTAPSLQLQRSLGSPLSAAQPL